MNEYKLCIYDLSEKEYKNYITEYFPYLCKAVLNKDDMKYLLLCMCNRSTVNKFFDIFISICSKYESDKKATIIGALCAVLSDNKADEAIPHIL